MELYSFDRERISRIEAISLKREKVVKEKERGIGFVVRHQPIPLFKGEKIAPFVYFEACVNLNSSAVRQSTLVSLPSGLICNSEIAIILSESHALVKTSKGTG